MEIGGGGNGWTSSNGFMSRIRSNSVCGSIRGAEVVVAGGMNNYISLSSSEILNIETMSWRDGEGRLDFNVMLTSKISIDNVSPLF